jgi:small subunit ribosomal protein S6
MMFILDPRQEPENLKNNVKELLTENGAEILEEREVGVQRLAYPIQKRDRGYYYIVYANLDPQKNEFLKRELNLKEPVMRYMFIKQEK